MQVRNGAIVSMAMGKPTVALGVIAKAFGVSHQRIHQILTVAGVHKERKSLRIHPSRYCKHCGVMIKHRDPVLPIGSRIDHRAAGVCRPCLTKYKLTEREHWAAMRQRRKDAGQCTYCSQPRMPDLCSCAYHRHYYSAEARREREARRPVHR